MNCIFRGLLRLLDWLVSFIMAVILVAIGIPIAIVFIAIVWLTTR